MQYNVNNISQPGSAEPSKVIYREQPWAAGFVGHFSPGLDQADLATERIVIRGLALDIHNYLNEFGLASYSKQHPDLAQKVRSALQNNDAGLASTHLREMGDAASAGKWEDPAVQKVEARCHGLGYDLARRLDSETLDWKQLEAA
jgi:hypothetical protein